MAVHFFIIGKLSTIVSTAVNVPARRLSKHSIRDLLAIIGKLGSAGNKSYKKKRIMCSRDNCKNKMAMVRELTKLIFSLLGKLFIL